MMTLLSGGLKKFVAEAPNDMAMFDREMRYIAASPGWLAVAGRKQTPVGRNLYEDIPGISDAWKAAHQRCLAGATETSKGERFERPGGGALWLRWEARPWREGNGAIGGIVITGEDITANVEAEKQAEGLARRAQEAEQRLSDALEASPEGFAIYDADDRLVVCNEATRAAYPDVADVMRPGIPFEQVLRLALARRPNGERAPNNETWLRERMKRHRNPTGAFEQQTDAGRWLRIAERRLPDGSVVTIRTDITDLKRGKQELALKNAVLEATFQNMGEGILVYDAEARLLAANDLAAQLLHAPLALFQPGAALADLVRFRAENGAYGEIDPGEAVRERVAMFHASQSWSRTRRHRSGRVIEMRFNPLPGGGGIYVFRDVTERAGDEAKLVRETALLQATLHNMGEGILVYDAGRRLLVVNEKAAQLLEAPAVLFEPGASHDALNRFRAERGDFGEEDPDEAVRERIALFEARQPWSRKQRHRNGRGIEIRFSPLPDGGGVFVLLDVTAAAEREAKLAEKTAVLEATLHNMGEGIAVYDAGRRLLACNEFTARVLDVPVALLKPGIAYGDISRLRAGRGDYGDVDIEAYVRESEIRFGATEPWTRTRRLRDGRVIETRLNPMQGGGAIFIFRDVTERADYEAKRAEETAVLEATFKNMGEGILFYDSDAKLIVSNDLAAQLLHAPRALLEHGAALADLLRYRAERGDYGEVDADEAVRGRMAEFHLRSWRRTLRNPDGRVIESRVNPMPDYGGGIFVLRDVTERADHEAKLTEALGKAERASQAKSEFLAMVSHELRTPMNAIIGLSGLLRERDLAPTERGYAATIETAGESLLVIIKDLLEFSSLESGKAVLDEAPFEAGALAASAIEVARVLPQAAGLTFRTDIDPVLPSALVGDGGRVRRILVNLLDNAVKHTAEGTVTIRARSRPAEAAETLTLRVEVEDTGAGFPPAETERLFQPFERGAPDRARAAGLGLGLAICRNLVDLMSGTIGADSTPGAGSRFWFEIPVRVPAPPPALPQASDARRPLKVLVAEDVEANRAVMAAMPEKLRHEADFAEDGAEAVEAAGKGDYDVILMDIQMPNMDGLEATRSIRGFGGRFESIPIIAVSAFSLPADRDAAFRAGASGFLTKPVRRSALDDALRSLTAPAG